MKALSIASAVLGAAALGALPLLARTVPVAGNAATLTIDNFAFSAGRLDVAAGTSVTWTNRDDIPHTVTAAEDPHATRSPPLDTGESYTRLFARSGTFHYFCSLHPAMQGMVVVH